MDTSVRFVKLIMNDKMDSNVIYVEESRIVQVGEFLDLPGGYRYKVLDNTHDGSLVVDLKPRPGLAAMFTRIFRTAFMMDNRTLPAGHLLLIEENPDDPALKAYYDFFERGKTPGADPGPDAAKAAPPQLPPAQSAPAKNTLYAKRRMMGWSAKAGWLAVVALGLMAYLKARDDKQAKLIEERQRAEKQQLQAEAAARDRQTSEQARELAEAIRTGKNDPTMDLMESARDMEGLWAFKEAETLLREALEVRQEALGDEHLKVVEAMEALAEILERQAMFEDAVKPRRRALEIRRKISGAEDRTIALASRALADVQRNAFHPDDARRQYDDALRLSRQFLSSEPVELARTLEGLSLLLADSGEFDQAESLAAEALALRKSAAPGETLDLADGLLHMGKIMAAKKDHKKAEEYYGQALVIKAKTLGRNDYDVTGIMLDLASSLFHSGEAALAADVYNEAVAARKKFHEQYTPGVMPGFDPDVQTHVAARDQKLAADAARRETTPPQPAK